MLSLRNFTVGLAENGLGIERIANYGKKELKTFADSFDRLLTKLNKNISCNYIIAAGSYWSIRSSAELSVLGQISISTPSVPGI